MNPKFWDSIIFIYDIYIYIYRTIGNTCLIWLYFLKALLYGKVSLSVHGWSGICWVLFVLSFSNVFSIYYGAAVTITLRIVSCHFGHIRLKAHALLHVILLDIKKIKKKLIINVKDLKLQKYWNLFCLWWKIKRFER